MTEHRLVSLVARQFTQGLEPTESAELTDWAAESDSNKNFLEVFTNEDRLVKELERFGTVDKAKGYDKLKDLMKTERRSHLIRISAWAAAAVVLALVAVPLSKLLGLRGNPDGIVTKTGSSILPGKDTFLLSQDPVSGYTVTTPRSGEHRLTLPDGSHVWLNDSSSIRYPAAFPGSDRTVALSGEAYFEIAPDANKPFVVKLKDATVEALGTGFDLSSYPGEGGSTATLVNGAVRVRTTRDSVTLTPNEQALVKADGSLGVDKNVPASEIMGWKDGYFFFSQTPLDQVLRQLARWYDIDIENDTNLPGLRFDGNFDRRVPLGLLLKNLGKSQDQIQFRLENRKLIILLN